MICSIAHRKKYWYLRHLWPNTTNGKSCLLFKKLRFLQYNRGFNKLSNDTQFLNIEVIFFFISFYFLYILHYILLIKTWQTICTLLYFIGHIYTHRHCYDYTAIYVAWWREMSHWSKHLNSYSIFTPFSHNFKILHFWIKPHYNWISGYRVMKNLSMVKTI